MSPNSPIACTFLTRLHRLFIPLFVVVAPAFLIFSCGRHHEQNSHSRPIPIREAKGYVVPQDSIETPISVQIDESKLKKVTVLSPKNVMGISHSYPAPSAETVAFLDKPLIRTSGQDPFVLPVEQEIIVTSSTASMPEIVEAKEMYSKDVNPANFSIFGKRQGLKHNVIWNMLEDHQGNLWFCVGEGFTKFDGKFFYYYPIPTGPISRFPQIFQDSSGNIWFGTTDSLVKYDGKSFTKFSFAHITGPLQKLMVDQSGTIWIAPKSGGISLILPAKNHADKNPISKSVPGEEMHTTDSEMYTLLHFGSKEGFTDEAVVNILEDRSGNHWFLLNNSDIIKLETSASSHNDSDVDQDDPNPVSQKPTFYTFQHFNWDGLQLTTMLEDHDGKLWFSSLGCVFVYDGLSVDRISDSQLTGEELYSRLEDSDGNLWFSTLENGLFRYAPPSQGRPGSFTRFTVNEGLSSNNIHGMLEDKNGMLWLGTDEGVNRYNGRMLTHITVKDGLIHPKALSILEDKSGNLWFGSYGLGVSVYDGKTFSYLNTKNKLMGDFVWSMVEDHAGNIWLGTLDNAVYRYSPSEENNVATITHFYNKNVFEGNINIVYEDQAGNIWSGGTMHDNSSILYRYTPQQATQRGTLTPFTLTGGLRDAHMILSILEDNEKNIWFGTYKSGLTRYTPPTANQPATFTQFSEKEGFSNNRVWSILKDHRGNLWFCTDGNGLVFYNGKTFVDFTVEEGLSNNRVLSSLSDHAGNLWFGTHFGLNMLPKNIVDSIAEKVLTGTLHESDIFFRTYMYDDGFLGIGCHLNSIYEDHRGTIWVGTNDRVTAYHPEGDVRDTFAPGIQLTGIDLFNESINWSNLAQHQDSTLVLGNGVKVKNLKFDGLSSWYSVPENLRLAHNNNYITFNFIGITMNRPGRVKYQYRLDGLDFNWSALTSNNFATYGNLPPGHYSFKVKAMNSERYWSREFEYPFTVRHPWRTRWWACCAYILLVAASLYTVFYLLKRRLLLRQQLKVEQDEAVRLKELDTFKSQLFTNLTHEFRTPLTVILGMAKQLTNGGWQSAVGEKEKGVVSNSLKLIENNGRNLLRLINQLLDLSKLENKSFNLQTIQSDIVPYLRYVTESFQSFAEDIHLKLRFNPHTEILVMDFDPEQMKQIMSNLISNALKFTPSGGEITVEVSSSSGILEIVVKDTGIGISAKDLPHVLERFYQVDSSNTRVAQGTGIGLAHTQELLKIMGGSISIESEIDKGTNVMVRLPIKHDEVLITNDEIPLTTIPRMSIIGLNNKPMENGSSSVDQEVTTNGSRPQLLIIEDSPDVVMYLRSCLEHAYQIDVAYNGNTGIEKAFEKIPDFIISDVMMPEKDGYQVCDTLKNDERTSHIPIILLTAKADAASRLAGLRRGADAYLAKPFDPEELLVRISVLLDNRRRIAAYFSKTLHNGTALPFVDASLTEEIQIEDAFLKKVNDIIAANYTEENISLPELCKEIGMSRSQLFRKTKAVADTNPSDMIRSYRLKKAKVLLETGDVSVAEATYQVGFKDPSYFSKLFQEEFGVQPKRIGNNE